MTGLTSQEELVPTAPRPFPDRCLHHLDDAEAAEEMTQGADAEAIPSHATRPTTLVFDGLEYGTEEPSLRLQRVTRLSSLRLRESTYSGGLPADVLLSALSKPPLLVCTCGSMPVFL